METWELIARERIRDTLARYTWSGDSMRLERLASAFCEEGVLEVRGRPAHEGREAIVAFLSGVGSTPAAPASGAKRIVRHNVTNVDFLELSTGEARVASYFTVITEIGLDHMGRYRDLLVPVGDEWLIRHRFVSTDWRSPDSTMAAPTAIEP